MNAHQQLVELLGQPERRSAWDFDAADFVRNHGHTLVELLEVMARLDAHKKAPFGSINAPMLGVAEYASLCVRRDDALRKLTQDA